MTVGSNTETRVATIDTTATSGDTTSASLALQAAGLTGTAGVSCQSSGSSALIAGVEAGFHAAGGAVEATTGARALKTFPVEVRDGASWLVG